MLIRKFIYPLNKQGKKFVPIAVLSIFYPMTKSLHIPKSICIVRLSALGDVLMLVPLIRTLQLAFPTCTITWVISRPAYDLVEGMNDVEFIVIDKPKHVLDYWRFKQQLRGRYFDVLLAVQASLEPIYSMPVLAPGDGLVMMP